MRVQEFMRVVLLITLVVFLFACTANAANLLQNPGFDSGPGGQLGAYSPPSWGSWGDGGWHHNDAGCYIGTKGIVIYHTETGVFQDVGVIAGDVYTFSMKVAHFTSQNPLTDHTAHVQAKFFNSSGVQIGALITVGTLTSGDPKDQWKTVSITRTAPANAVTARLQFLIATGGTPHYNNKAYFEDASIEGNQFVAPDPDFDDDGRVDYNDFYLLTSDWALPSVNYDMDGDGSVDFNDFSIFFQDWGRGTRPPEGYQLVWADEFDGPTIDSGNWTHQTGTGPQGWGNWEWQYYTNRPENSRIESGRLVIEARRESYGGMSYTSARLKTQIKQSFMYGRIEARIKMPPGGTAIWPAFWMLGDNVALPSVSWPSCGEIDIIEMMSTPFEAKGTIWYGQPGNVQSNGSSDFSGGDLSTKFHVYAIEWEPTEIRWYRNSSLYHTAYSSTWWSDTGPPPLAPFDQTFFILLNFAYGAHWWDWNDHLLVPFPQQMYVDYVRAYEAIP